MFVFVCAGCGAHLTAPLSEVALPAHAHQKYGNGIQLPALMEPGTLRDDPPPPRPHHLFRADSGTFQHTLARLAAVRSPWLREILENLTQHMHTRLF
ncbi:hypothetical protein ACFSL4_13340 [Streptomyces caeni]|uniref:C2H2-type domain-containing protein n=1 Tax=Streptomyces caeni TaxID=2307231 RepID=A0ABW4IRI3_9ACTN